MYSNDRYPSTKTYKDQFLVSKDHTENTYSFTNNFQISYYSILHQRVIQKLILIDTLGVLFDLGNTFLDMSKVYDGFFTQLLRVINSLSTFSFTRGCNDL